MHGEADWFTVINQIAVGVGLVSLFTLMVALILLGLTIALSKLKGLVLLTWLRISDILRKSKGE